MKIQEFPEKALSGMVVEGYFSELGQLVPEAWQRLAESRSPRNLPYVAFSQELPNERCLEVLGLYKESGTLDSALQLETVQVPAGTWVVTTHDGPASTIYETFGRMQQWAATHGYTDTGEKIDSGYRLDGSTNLHTLSIRILPQHH